ncbi:c-type cytochrome [Zwartia sp.]|uniref:c-type cytochrome n=1 Tax=Zwartia sp. TaxID=2978004 RepID=UPI002720233E|nr:c-type cytochrome [Zwartia sp.]MDO9024517.1 c-type cytochrome [Zwartia sp.]
MKRVLSKVVLVSGLLLGVSAVSTSMAAGPVTGPAKPDAAKGALLYEQGDAARGVLACVSCHGAAGNSSIPANPNISAQAHEYLYKQLVEFRVKPGAKAPLRNGADGAPSVMTVMAAPLTEADMHNLAYYLSLQKLAQPATATNEKLVEQGQKIWRGGIPDRNVPACAGCHSPNGAGIPAQYPRLSGQFPSYIEDQLKLFRAGHRGNSAMMNQIANRMSDSDIKAVSDYAAGLR